MPIYQLNDSCQFPPVHHAEEGIIAVGGDLSPERLIAAYSGGIFPWFSKDDPIIWWAPDPRFVLFPEKLKVSKSMKQLFKKTPFEVTFDTKFEAVVNECAIQKREGQDDTWITNEMKRAYHQLHKNGLAHSVEVWSSRSGKRVLVGGLYGVSIGSVFFGESMFHKESNASKYGFITLMNHLVKRGFELIDCQMETPHLRSLGAELISRNDFMVLLKKSLNKETLQGNWITWAK